MKPVYAKLLIGALCFIFGSFSVLAFQRFYKPEENPSPLRLAHHGRSMDPIFDQFFNDDFFERSRDPFEEMRQMRERMLKQFDRPEEGGGLFDSWYQKKFGGGEAGEIKKREDDRFVYYDIAIKGLNKNDFKVIVENGQIDISGQVEQKAEEGSSVSHYVSRFHRSFPAPPDVEADKFQLEQEADKLILKFPKVKNSEEKSKGS